MVLKLKHLPKKVMNRPALLRKSFAFTSQDLDHLNRIREKCEEVDVSDSHIIRVALYLAASLSREEWAVASRHIPKMPVGKLPAKS